MNATIKILRIAIRGLGVLQIVVGICLWFGVGGSGLIAFHSAAGSLFVLALLVLAVIALFALPARGFPLLGLVWGGLTLWLGMAQMTLLVGAMHWLVRVVHLIVGLAAMGIGEGLAGRLTRHRAAQAQAAAS